MPVLISVNLEDEAWQRILPEAPELAEQAARLVLRAQGWGRRNVMIDITLLDDKAQRRLNRDWRGKDKPTNVLSFPLEGPEVKVPRGRPRQLGDLTLARQTLVREAKEQAKPLAAHFTHLVVHGVLHLLGYDHIKLREAKVMESLEVQLLARLGLPDPYAESTKQKVTVK